MGGECSSVGRAPDCGSGCRGFNPHHSPHFFAPVAQGIERRPPEPGAEVRFLPGAPVFRVVLVDLIQVAVDQAVWFDMHRFCFI